MSKLNKTVWCDVGYFPYRFGFCPSARAWKTMQQISKRELGPYPPLETKACCTMLRDYKNDLPVAVVTLREGFTSQVAADLLIHEATHIWQDLRRAIGEERPSSEFEAYTLQHLTAKLFVAYQKTRGPLFSRR